MSIKPKTPPNPGQYLGIDPVFVVTGESLPDDVTHYPQPLQKNTGPAVIAIGPKGGQIIAYTTDPKSGKQIAIYKGSKEAAKWAADNQLHDHVHDGIGLDEYADLILAKLWVSLRPWHGQKKLLTFSVKAADVPASPALKEDLRALMTARLFAAMNMTASGVAKASKVSFSVKDDGSLVAGVLVETSKKITQLGAGQPTKIYSAWAEHGKTWLSPHVTDSQKWAGSLMMAGEQWVLHHQDGTDYHVSAREDLSGPRFDVLIPTGGTAWRAVGTAQLAGIMPVGTIESYQTDAPLTVSFRSADEALAYVGGWRPDGAFLLASSLNVKVPPANAQILPAYKTQPAGQDYHPVDITYNTAFQKPSPLDVHQSAPEVESGAIGSTFQAEASPDVTEASVPLEFEPSPPQPEAPPAPVAPVELKQSEEKITHVNPTTHPTQPVLHPWPKPPVGEQPTGWPAWAKEYWPGTVAKFVDSTGQTWAVEYAAADPDFALPGQVVDIHLHNLSAADGGDHFGLSPEAAVQVLTSQSQDAAPDYDNLFTVDPQLIKDLAHGFFSGLPIVVDADGHTHLDTIPKETVVPILTDHKGPTAEQVAKHAAAQPAGPGTTSHHEADVAAVLEPMKMSGATPAHVLQAMAGAEWKWNVEHTFADGSKEAALLKLNAWAAHGTYGKPILSELSNPTTWGTAAGIEIGVLADGTIEVKEGGHSWAFTPAISQKSPKGAEFAAKLGFGQAEDNFETMPDTVPSLEPTAPGTPDPVAQAPDPASEEPSSPKAGTETDTASSAPKPHPTLLAAVQDLMATAAVKWVITYPQLGDKNEVSEQITTTPQKITTWATKGTYAPPAAGTLLSGHPASWGSGHSVAWAQGADGGGVFVVSHGDVSVGFKPVGTKKELAKIAAAAQAAQNFETMPEPDTIAAPIEPPAEPPAAQHNWAEWDGHKELSAADLDVAPAGAKIVAYTSDGTTYTKKADGYWEGGGTKFIPSASLGGGIYEWEEPLPPAPAYMEPDKEPAQPAAPAKQMLGIEHLKWLPGSSVVKDAAGQLYKKTSWGSWLPVTTVDGSSGTPGKPHVQNYDMGPAKVVTVPYDQFSGPKFYDELPAGTVITAKGVGPETAQAVKQPDGTWQKVTDSAVKPTLSSADIAKHTVVGVELPGQKDAGPGQVSPTGAQPPAEQHNWAGWEGYKTISDTEAQTAPVGTTLTSKSGLWTATKTGPATWKTPDGNLTDAELVEDSPLLSVKAAAETYPAPPATDKPLSELVQVTKKPGKANLHLVAMEHKTAVGADLIKVTISGATFENKDAIQAMASGFSSDAAKWSAVLKVWTVLVPHEKLKQAVLALNSTVGHGTVSISPELSVLADGVDEINAKAAGQPAVLAPQAPGEAKLYPLAVINAKPAGAKLQNADGSVTITKLPDGKWSSETKGSETVGSWTAKQVASGMWKEPASAFDLPGVGQAVVSPIHLDQMPIGTQLIDVDKTSTYTKSDKGWTAPGSAAGTTMTFSPDQMSWYLQDGLTVLSYPGEQHNWEGWAGKKNPTPDELDAAPVGTVLAGSAGIGPYVKMASGAWVSQANHDYTYTPGFLGKYELSIVGAEPKLASNPASGPDDPHDWAGWDGEKVLTKADFASIPVGIKLIAAGVKSGYIVKLQDGSWVSDTGQQVEPYPGSSFAMYHAPPDPPDPPKIAETIDALAQQVPTGHYVPADQLGAVKATLATDGPKWKITSTYNGQTITHPPAKILAWAQKATNTPAGVKALGYAKWKASLHNWKPEQLTVDGTTVTWEHDGMKLVFEAVGTKGQLANVAQGLVGFIPSPNPGLNKGTTPIQAKIIDAPPKMVQIVAKPAEKPTPGQLVDMSLAEAFAAKEWKVVHSGPLEVDEKIPNPSGKGLVPSGKKKTVEVVQVAIPDNEPAIHGELLLLSAGLFVKHPDFFPIARAQTPAWDGWEGEKKPSEAEVASAPVGTKLVQNSPIGTKEYVKVGPNAWVGPNDSKWTDGSVSMHSLKGTATPATVTYSLVVDKKKWETAKPQVYKDAAVSDNNFATMPDSVRARIAQFGKDYRGVVTICAHHENPKYQVAAGDRLYVVSGKSSVSIYRENGELMTGYPMVVGKYDATAATKTAKPQIVRDIYQEFIGFADLNGQPWEKYVQVNHIGNLKVSPVPPQVHEAAEKNHWAQYQHQIDTGKLDYYTASANDGAGAIYSVPLPKEPWEAFVIFGSDGQPAQMYDNGGNLLAGTPGDVLATGGWTDALTLVASAYEVEKHAYQKPPEPKPDGSYPTKGYLASTMSHAQAMEQVHVPMSAAPMSGQHGFLFAATGCLHGMGRIHRIRKTDGKTVNRVSFRVGTHLSAWLRHAAETNHGWQKVSTQQTLKPYSFDPAIGMFKEFTDGKKHPQLVGYAGSLWHIDRPCLVGTIQVDGQSVTARIFAGAKDTEVSFEFPAAMSLNAREAARKSLEALMAGVKPPKGSASLTVPTGPALDVLAPLSAADAELHKQYLAVRKFRPKDIGDMGVSFHDIRHQIHAWGGEPTSSDYPHEALQHPYSSTVPTVAKVQAAFAAIPGASKLVLNHKVTHRSVNAFFDDGTPPDGWFKTGIGSVSSTSPKAGVDRIMSVLNLGLQGAKVRNSQHGATHIGGQSTQSDIDKGDGDVVFMRGMSGSGNGMTSSLGGNMTCLVDPRVAGDAGMTFTTTDSYGAWHAQISATHGSSLAGVRSDMKNSHDTEFLPHSVDSSLILAIGVPGSARSAIIAELKARGVHAAHGIPIDEFIVEGDGYQAKEYASKVVAANMKKVGL